MEKLFDTHAHYTDERLFGNDELLSQIFADDVGHIITVAVNAEDSEKCIALAGKYKNMFASAGIHPEEAKDIVDIGAEVAKIEKLLTREKVVAVGEIGLDYHWDREHIDKQKELFDMQMSLAEKYSLPVIIHDREAHGDVFDILKKYKDRVRGVMHCYSGHAEMVREYVKLGYYISFAGVVTYKNALKAVEAARAVPLDRILVETDCPYLAPVPKRHKTNSSAYLHYTADFLADTLGISREEFYAATTANATSFFLKEKGSKKNFISAL